MVVPFLKGCVPYSVFLLVTLPLNIGESCTESLISKDASVVEDVLHERQARATLSDCCP